MNRVLAVLHHKIFNNCSCSYGDIDHFFVMQTLMNVRVMT